MQISNNVCHTGNIGISQVYYEYVQALKNYGHYTPETQSTRSREICNHILYSFDLLKCDVHYLAYMLDVRYIKNKEYLKDHNLNHFLEIVEEIINDDDHYATFQKYFLKFRAMEALFNYGISRQSGGVTNRRIFTNTPERD